LDDIDVMLYIFVDIKTWVDALNVT